MIRFIDLGEQIGIPGIKHFAWWDTITDEFLEFSTSLIWETWDQFEADYRFSFPTTEKILKGYIPNPERLARFKRLFPKEWP